MSENQMTRTLLYVGEEGEVAMEVIIDNERETMRATQKTMAEVFNVNGLAISKHLKNIFNFIVQEFSGFFKPEMNCTLMERGFSYKCYMYGFYFFHDEVCEYFANALP